jgi:UDP-2,3-diacylglucosamine pyrophosphatase LpxH
LAKAKIAQAIAEKAALAAGRPPEKAEQVTQTRDGDTLEARSVSARIRTVEDLLAHIEADLQRFEVAASEATKWEVATSDADGTATVTELHRVWVRLKPKGGPTTLECVASMIEAAKKEIRRIPKKVYRQPKRDGLWQVLVVADCHFGKYAWGRTTGGDDYDLDLAERLVGQAGDELVAVGDSHKPTRRTIAFLGDLFHYDRPDGSTTSGTPLERDGRLQKMIAVGCDTLLRIVERSSQSVPTDVVIVNGNHDEVLTWTFQRILSERFRGSKSVRVKEDFTGRQYLTHGRNLLGFAHGHRAKKKLPQIMALEASQHWAKCPYREWHTGHFHSQAAEWQRPIETLDGVIVRTAPALCPPDDWHSVNGFIGSRQACETFIYEPDGGLCSMHVASPRAKA